MLVEKQHLEQVVQDCLFTIPEECLGPVVQTLVESLKLKLTTDFAREVRQELLGWLTDQHYFLCNSSLFEGGGLRRIELALSNEEEAAQFKTTVGQTLALNRESLAQSRRRLATDWPRMVSRFFGIDPGSAESEGGAVWQQYQTAASHLDPDLLLLAPALLSQTSSGVWNHCVGNFIEWLNQKNCPIMRAQSAGHLTDVSFKVGQGGKGWALTMELLFKSVHQLSSHWRPEDIGLLKGEVVEAEEGGREVTDLDDSQMSKHPVMRCVFEFGFSKQVRGSESIFTASSRVTVTPYTRALYGAIAQFKAEDGLADRSDMTYRKPIVPGTDPRPRRSSPPVSSASPPASAHRSTHRESVVVRRWKEAVSPARSRRLSEMLPRSEGLISQLLRSPGVLSTLRSAEHDAGSVVASAEGGIDGGFDLRALPEDAFCTPHTSPARPRGAIGSSPLGARRRLAAPGPGGLFGGAAAATVAAPERPNRGEAASSSGASLVRERGFSAASSGRLLVASPASQAPSSAGRSSLSDSIREGHFRR